MKEARQATIKCNDVGFSAQLPLRPPDIAGAGRRLLSSNDRQSDITRYLVPCPGLVPTQGIQNGLGMIVKNKKV